MEREAAVAFFREMMTGPLEVLDEELRLAEGAVERLDAECGGDDDP